MPKSPLEWKNAAPLESPARQTTQRRSRRIFSPSSRTLSTDELPFWIEQWLLEGECQLKSPKTQYTYRVFLKNFLWFMENRQLASCGEMEMRQFFAYLATGHTEPGGRWGIPKHNRPPRPITVKDYYCALRTFFGWLIRQDVIDENPMERIPRPIARPDQKPPLSTQHIELLLQTARKGYNARRDEAILFFLLDTGVRSSELVNIRMHDLDIAGRQCRVLGKGNKYRTVFFGQQTTRALLFYLRQEKQQENETLFFSAERKPLTRSGLQQMLKRHAKTAGIQCVVSPHAFRRTFAVEILKNGANIFSLREMLGHTNLQMTQKYLMLAQSDIEEQHRQYSPADLLGQKKKEMR